MGAGIAQLAAQAGCRVLVHDPADRAIERALDGIRRRLERDVERGGRSREDAATIAGRLEPAVAPEDLGPAGLVIEAEPEDLSLKEDLFGRLEDVVPGDAVLATNTSSLPVTAIAGRLRRPERVVGMHFFNPPVLMRLVEVVAGERSAQAAVDVARAAAVAMGNVVVVAVDAPGFLVNRCNRPFNLEALRVVEEGLSTPEQVDRIVRLGGGFPMGPFELMDLVGLD